MSAGREEFVDSTAWWSGDNTDHRQKMIGDSLLIMQNICERSRGVVVGTAWWSGDNTDHRQKDYKYSPSTTS